MTENRFAKFAGDGGGGNRFAKFVNPQEAPPEDVFGPLKRDSTGQLFIEPQPQHDILPPWDERGTAMKVATAPLEAADAVIPDDPGGMVLGGLRNAAVGALTLPADALTMAGVPGYDKVSEDIKHFVPEFRQADTAGKIGQAVTQFAAPGAKGAELAVNAAERLPGMAAEAPGLFQKLLKGVAGMAGAGAADAAVTDTNQASTLGDLFGGPTDIKPDDSNMAKRVKVGAETMAAEPAAQGVIGAAKLAGKGAGMVRDLVKPLSETAQGAKLAEVLQGAVTDKGKAIENIDKSLAEHAGSDYKPLAGSASGDPGLLRAQQSQANTGPVADRIAQNEEVTAGKFNDLTTPKGGEGAIDKLKPLAEQAKTEALAPANQAVSDVGANLDKVNKDMEAAAANLAANKGRKTAASENLDQTIRQIDESMTKAKNDLYQQADPEGTLRRPADDLLNEVDGIKLEEGQDPASMPTQLIEDIKNLSGDGAEEAAAPSILDPNSRVAKINVDAEGKPITQAPPEGEAAPAGDGTVSFRYLVNMRQRISDEITAARAAGQGVRVKNLVQLKGAINNQIDGFAEALSPEMKDAADKLRAAQDYYSEEFAPRFKQGEGGKLRQAMKSGRPGAAPPSATAGRFLGPGTGAKERAGALNQIVEKAKNPGAAKASTREYLISDMADSVTDGKNINPERLDAWIQKNRDTLAQNPDVQKEVMQMKNRVAQGGKVKKQIEADLEAATQGVKKTEKEFNDSAVGLFLKTDDPAKAVADALNSATPAQRIAQLKKLAGKDTSGQAMEGLRDLVRRNLRDTVRQSSETSSGELLKPSNAKMISLFEQPEKVKAVESLFDNPQDIKNLRAVRAQLKDMSKKAQGTAGSITEPLRQQGDQVRIALASVYGITRGRGLFQVGKWVEKALGRDPEKMANDLLNSALLDPKLAKTLLMKETKQNEPIIEKELRTYISNNLVGTGEQRQKENQGKKK